MGSPRAGTAVWGRICVGQPVDAGMRRVVAARLSSGRFWQLERAPQGVVALLAPVGNRPRVFVQRAGRSRVAVLPRASLAPGHRVEGYELTSEWPRLTLCGGLMGPAPPLGDLEPVGSIIWESSDGGATWRSGVGAAFEKPYCDEQTIE
jgi:hypothetical protein